MSEPITWRMLEDVRDALALVQVSRGFRTDLGVGVIALEGEQLPEDDSPYTMILAETIVVDDTNSTRSTIKSDMDIVIEFAVPFAATENAQLLAHRARADVIRALIPLRKDIKDRPLGVNSFQITGTAIQQPADGAAVIIAQVTARAGLSESQSSPA